MESRKAQAQVTSKLWRRGAAEAEGQSGKGAHAYSKGPVGSNLWHQGVALHGQVALCHSVTQWIRGNEFGI
eukprot:12895593-Prorocentrum_lima.AAC.1